MSTAPVEPGNIPEWTIGDRLRKARESQGLTQDEMAERTGLSVGTISNAESGRRGVRKVTIKQYALATGVPEKWLETGEAPTTSGGDGGLRGADTQSFRPADRQPHVESEPPFPPSRHLRLVERRAS